MPKPATAAAEPAESATTAESAAEPTPKPATKPTAAT